jgi:hypothetical protein
MSDLLREEKGDERRRTKKKEEGEVRVQKIPAVGPSRTY